MQLPERITIIIPTYNRAKFLYRALESLADQKDSGNSFEVIVIDDGCKDKTKEVCDDFFSKLNLKYIHQSHKGISVARNSGIEESSGDVIVFFDDDAVASDDWVAKIKKNISGEDMITGRVKPIKNNIWQYFAPHYNQGDHHIVTDYLIEGNCVIRKQVFENVGGFDENLTYGHDGAEFVSRAKEKYNIKYCPDVIIYHDYAFGLLNYLSKQFKFGNKMVYLNVDKINSFFYLLFNYKKLRSGGVGIKKKENKIIFLNKIRIFPIFKLGTVAYLIGASIGYLKYRK